MTDEISGGAPAPAESITAPVVEQKSVPIQEPAAKTAPLGSQTPEPKPVAEKPETPKPAASVREAVEKAREAVKAKEAAVPVKEPIAAKPVVEPKARAEDGKFVAKETAAAPAVAKEAVQEVQAKEGVSERPTKYEPPARFVEAAKAEWTKVPEPVQAEIHRAIQNAEKGVEKHRESAERYELVREYDELARKNGREGLHESMKQIIDIENTFARDPIQGLKKITDHFGVNLQAVAAHIMGQNPDQQIQEAHTRIRELEGQIQKAEQQAKLPDMVAKFAAEHERFDELSEHIAKLLSKGIVKDLEQAYDMADMFVPRSSSSDTNAPASSAAQEQAPASSAQPAPKPLNVAGLKSVSGAPSTGGTQAPGGKVAIPIKDTPSIRDALRKNLAKAS